MSNPYDEKNGYAEGEPELRYRIGINAVSLKEEDAEVPAAEEIAEGNQMFLDTLKILKDDRERLIAIALFIGLKQSEIAYIMTVHYSLISQIASIMQKRLDPLGKRKSRI